MKRGPEQKLPQPEYATNTSNFSSDRTQQFLRHELDEVKAAKHEGEITRLDSKKLQEMIKADFNEAVQGLNQRD